MQTVGLSHDFDKVGWQIDSNSSSLYKGVMSANIGQVGKVEDVTALSKRRYRELANVLRLSFITLLLRL